MNALKNFAKKGGDFWKEQIFKSLFLKNLVEDVFFCDQNFLIFSNVFFDFINELTFYT